MSGDSCTPISGSDLGNFNHEGVTLRKKNDFEDFITVKSLKKENTTESKYSPCWNRSGFWLLWPSPTLCNSHHVLPKKGFWDQRGGTPEQTLHPHDPVQENKYIHTYTLKRWDDSQRKNWDIVPKVQYSSSSYICFGFSHCGVMLNLNVVKYHEDMDEVASGGIPHFQRQIVCRCYHCAVVAIPCYHGNLQLCHFVF